MGRKVELGKYRGALVVGRVVEVVVGSVVVVVTASDTVNWEYFGLGEASSTTSTVPLDIGGLAPFNPVLRVSLMDLLLSKSSGFISYRVGPDLGCSVEATESYDTGLEWMIR